MASLALGLVLTWRTTTFGEGVHGVPFLQEPRVLIANTKLLKASAMRFQRLKHGYLQSRKTGIHLILFSARC